MEQNSLPGTILVALAVIILMAIVVISYLVVTHRRVSKVKRYLIGELDLAYKSGQQERWFYLGEIQTATHNYVVNESDFNEAAQAAAGDRWTVEPNGNYAIFRRKGAQR